MFDWNPATNTKHIGWFNAPSYAWTHWKPEHPKAPAHKPIIVERCTATLLEEAGPAKRPKLENWTLFDLIPMDNINIIDDRIIGLEHYKTFNPIV